MGDVTDAAGGHPVAQLVFCGVVIGLAVGVMAACGLVAMSMFVAATEDGRYQDAECVCEQP